MKNILVTGSVAYDHLLTFAGEFKESIIAEQLEHLSVSFTADSHKTDFGGCAANIAYSLRLLGENPLLFGVAGNDFERYAQWLQKNDISTKYLVKNKDYPTANAYVLTDREYKQISIFSPAAMQEHEIEIKLPTDATADIALALIAPELPKRMLYFVDYFKELNVPYVFDPGQSLPALSADELKILIDNGIGTIVNEYESEMLMKKTGLKLPEIAERSGFLIRTLSERGCEYFKDGERVLVPAVPDITVVDVTGTGDAFRAGFLHAYVNDENFKKACAMGNVAASFALEFDGTQKHNFIPEQFQERLALL